MQGGAWRGTRSTSIRYGRGMQLVNGAALIARLMKSADDLGVQLRVSSPATQLLADGGAVRGAVVATPDGAVTIRAARGVVLAAGGFPHDVARRRELFPRTPTGREHWALPPEAVAGDGVRLGESVGGRFVRDLASPVAWCPVSIVPYRNGRTGLYPHIIDRGKPGIIGVLADGRRFVNEADGYHDYVSAMVDGRAARRRSGVVADLRSRVPAALRVRNVQAVSVPGVAVRAFRLPAARAHDRGTRRRLRHRPGRPRRDDRRVQPARAARRGSAFGRGTTPFNRGSGDPDHKPNPCVAPIERPPFYAIKVLPGSFGTFAGLATDAFARVLDAGGKPIEGLYAAGNDQASVMGGHYPSGGINLGPAMTFGFIAGRHAAGADAAAPAKR